MATPSNFIKNEDMIEGYVKMLNKPCIYFDVIDYSTAIPAMEKLASLLECTIFHLGNNNSLVTMNTIEDAVHVCNMMATKQFRKIYVAAYHPEIGLYHTNNN